MPFMHSTREGARINLNSIKSSNYFKNINKNNDDHLPNSEEEKTPHKINFQHRNPQLQT